MYTEVEFLTVTRSVITGMKAVLNRKFTDEDLENCMEMVADIWKINYMTSGLVGGEMNPLATAMAVIQDTIEDRPYLAKGVKNR